MGSAIQFAVRDMSGNRLLGTVAGEDGGNLIQVGAGESISLNISPSSVVAYQQQGSDLIITLADGRTITLAGYFDPAGGAEHLYLSSNGEITEVLLTGDGSGFLTAGYGPSEGFEKWSPLDDLKFTEADSVADAFAVSDEPAGMGLFAPALLAGGAGAAGAGALGLAGLGLLGGGGGGGGGSGGGGGQAVPVAITDGTKGTGDVENKAEHADGVTIAGTGLPGANISVLIDGVTRTTTVGANGTWTVTFLPTEVAGGERETNVTVTATSGGKTTTVTDVLVLDTIPNPIAINSVTNDNTVSQAEWQAGFAVTGTTAPNATVTVNVGGFTRDVTANAQGVWSLTVPNGTLVGGTRDVAITVTSTDAAGNPSTQSGTFRLDTDANADFGPPVAVDNRVNGVEAQGAITMSGTSDQGMTSISVTWGNTTLPATWDANGNWTVTFQPGQIPADGSTVATVTATDAAGNTTQSTRNILVDRVNGVTLDATQFGDNVINNSERQSGVNLTGTGEAGSTVTVEFLGTTRQVVVGQNGTWSLNYSTAGIPQGTMDLPVKVTSVDLAGNTAEVTRTLRLDTVADVTFNAQQTANGDNLITGAERTQGVTLNGTSEPFAKIDLTFGGSTKTVWANAQGQWSVNYAAGEIPSGTVANSPVVIRATDAFGNTNEITRSIGIDTEVSPMTISNVARGADGVVNHAEASAGVLVNGTVEAGSRVFVTFANGTEREATVNGTTWSITVPSGDIPMGQQNYTLTARAVDAYGNTGAAVPVTVPVDRIVQNFSVAQTQLGGDGYINAAERAQGLTINGTAEVGSTVQVNIGTGAPVSVLVGNSGTWSVTFAANQIPQGELSGAASRVTVNVTDAAGNTTSATRDVIIDTVAPDHPDLHTINQGGGFTNYVSSKDMVNDYHFSMVGTNGQVTALNDVTVTNPFTGTRDFYFGTLGAPTPVPDGSYLVVSAQDAAGNQSASLVITDSTSQVAVNLNRAGLSQFDFASIDLTFVPEARLTLTEADITRLTGPDKKLVVNADDNETITMLGAIKQAGTEMIGGVAHNIYKMGDATVYLNMFDKDGDQVTPVI